MADGDDTPTARPLRRAVPTFDGPLASSGAAPEAGSPGRTDPAPPPVPAPRAAPDLTGTASPGERPPPPDTPPPPGTPAVTDTPAETSAVTGTPTTADTPAQTPAATDTPTAGDTPAVAGGPAATETAVATGAAPAEAGVVRRRIPNPWRLAGSSARATRAWSRRPTGRLVVPGLSLLLVVVATGVAGAILVPVAGRGTQVTGATATPDQTTAAPTVTAPGFPTPSLPGVPPVGQPTADPIGGAPGDVLTDWAAQVGQRVVVSEVAMRAYGYAELVLARTTPGCQLTWTTLAAIGLVESNHGRANGATLQADGLASPHIIGLPLDGKGGRQLIVDTDGGAMDGDPVYDRAVGPMQFIPTTWQEDGADADNDGVENPHDIDDAALAAGNYLCKGGRDLSTADDWWNAILSYNDVRPYAQAVFDAANRYGAESRT
nr:murein transglycosylase [Micromonospora sp. DSM 115978]